MGSREDFQRLTISSRVRAAADPTAVASSPALVIKKENLPCTGWAKCISQLLKEGLSWCVHRCCLFYNFHCYAASATAAAVLQSKASRVGVARPFAKSLKPKYTATTSW